MTFRIDAGLRSPLRRAEIVREATGSPVSMYASTIERRISRSRPESACCSEDLALDACTAPCFAFYGTACTAASRDMPPAHLAHRELLQWFSLIPKEVR